MGCGRPASLALPLLLLLVPTRTQGSDSHASSAEQSGEDESYNKNHREEKKTGVQHKFWVPTYPGTNPLGRKKISITTSEIEKYDKTIDVSLSDVFGGGTRRPVNRKENHNDTEMMPFLWSGDEINTNRSDNAIPMMDSGIITLESESRSNGNKAQSSISNAMSGMSEEDSILNERIEKKVLTSPKTKLDTAKRQTLKEKNNRLQNQQFRFKSPNEPTVKVKPKPTVIQKIETIMTLTNPITEIIKKEDNDKTNTYYFSCLNKTKVDDGKPNLHSITTNKTERIHKVTTAKTKLNHFKSVTDKTDLNSLEETTDDERLTPEYYKKLVKIASENTYRKLGYKPIKLSNEQHSKVAGPEIIAVNIDSKSVELPKFDDIDFKTHHEQLSERQEGKINVEKQAEEQAKRAIKLKALETELNLKPQKSKMAIKVSSSNETLGSKHKSEDEGNSFTSSCDYSAWSDILLRNKTERKGMRKKKRAKPVHPENVLSREIPRGIGKDVKNKADALRKKDKKSKKAKREKQIKKRKAEQIQKNRQKYDDEYQDDYEAPKKKIRMRTTGEKNYAIKEVKHYLKDMDQKYGGRPGRRREPIREGKTSFETYDNDYRDQERTKGRDRKRRLMDGTSMNERDHYRGDQRDFRKGVGRPRGRGFVEQRGGNRGYQRSDNRKGGRGRYDFGGAGQGRYESRGGGREGREYRRSGRGKYRRGGGERGGGRGGGRVKDYGRKGGSRSRGRGRRK